MRSLLKKRLVLSFLAMVVAAFAASSQDKASTETINDILEHSKKIQAQAQGKAPESKAVQDARSVDQLMSSPALKALVKSHSAESQNILAKAPGYSESGSSLSGQLPKPTSGAVIYVLTTKAILEDTVIRVIGDLSLFNTRYPGVASEAHVAIRGLTPPDRTITATIDRLSPLVSKARLATGNPQGTLNGVGSVPLEVGIDPRPFTDFGQVVLAPVVIIHYPNGDVARADGIVTPTFVHERYLAGVKNQGRLGPPVEIAERSLLDEISDRIAKLDGPKIQRDAQKRFWARLGKPAVDLPTAQLYTRREFDFSFRTQTDLTDNNGKVLVASGTTFNPLQQMAFNRHVVVFNPSTPGEVETVQALIRSAAMPSHQIRLIATHFATKPGIAPEQAQRDLETAFKSKVFLLDPLFTTRFSIASTPTYIRADNTRKVMIVSEHPLIAPFKR